MKPGFKVKVYLPQPDSINPATLQMHWQEADLGQALSFLIFSMEAEVSHLQRGRISNTIRSTLQVAIL